MHIDYTYTHTETLAGTGYFAAVPDSSPDSSLDTETLTSALETQPFDTFLHSHLLRALLDASASDLAARAKRAATLGKGAEYALLRECAHLRPDMADLPAIEQEVSPLSLSEPDPTLAALQEKIRANRDFGTPLPPRADLPSDALFRAVQTPCPEESRGQGREQNALYRDAADALMEAGILAGPEMRHEASLAPIALLRDWRIGVQVTERRNDWTLAGTARAYGRGFSLLQARLSCIMEVVERASAYVSCDGNTITNRQTPLPIILATVSELTQAGRAFVHPTKLPLDYPLRTTAYTWVLAKTPTEDEILVPAQAVFLFWNADEPELFRAPGSTGLAAGASMAGAKVSALLEVLERDAEATVPFSWERSFRLTTTNPGLAALLDDYAAHGIEVCFQEKMTEFGIPVFQAFVLAEDGRIHGAHACKLSAQRAVLSALGEVPWPYARTSHGRATGKPRDLPVRSFEELGSEFDSRDTGSDEANLAFLEERLVACGVMPLYVDLTRRDLAIPVVRAILPGLEVASDSDANARVPARLLARWLA